MIKVIWWFVAIIITVGMWSWLWKDNFFFRVLQRTFVAFGAAHYFNLAIVSLRNMVYFPIILKADYLRIVPLLLGILTWFIMTRKYYWISRYGLLVLVAVTTSLSLTGLLPSQVIGQITGLLGNLYKYKNLWDIAWAYIGVIIVILIMSYFFFIWLQKPSEKFANAGRFIIMTSFGVLFGSVLLGYFIQLVHMLVEIFMMKFPF
jgi:hypothetical protein